MNSGYEQLLMQRLFQNEGGWTHAVYLAAIFFVIIWRRESIVSWSLFRASFWLFAAAIVVPTILQPLLQLFINTSMGPSRGLADQQLLVWILYNGSGPLLFAAAIICGLSSLIPRRTRFITEARPAQPHPLD